MKARFLSVLFAITLIACGGPATPGAGTGSSGSSAPPPASSAPQSSIPQASVPSPSVAASAPTQAPAVQPTTASAAPSAQPTKTTAPKPSATATEAAKTGSKVVVGDWVVATNQYSAYLYGYVVNKGDTAAEDINVVASLLNSKGDAVATGNSIYTRDLLPPGERSPFTVVLDPTPLPKYNKVEVQVEASDSDPDSFTASTMAEGLKITQHKGRKPASEYDAYTVSGQLKNTGPGTAKFVSILGIGYDKKGKPVAVEQGYAKLEKVKPGQTSPFSLDFRQNQDKIVKYDLYVSGMKANI